MKLVQLLVATTAVVCAEDAQRRLASAGELTDSDETTLLDMHNDYRSEVALGNTGTQPGATNMNSLKWDDTLAMLAKSYADKCTYTTNENRESELEALVEGGYETTFRFDSSSLSVGENLYMSQNGGDLDDLTGGVTSWWDQYKDYTYTGTDAGTCSSATHDCSDYLQMAYDETRYVGCGYAVCNPLEEPMDDDTTNSVSGATFLVCNYFVEFAIRQPPYAENTGEGAASQCESDRTADSSTGLCAGCMAEYWTYCKDVYGNCARIEDKCPTWCTTESTCWYCKNCRTTCGTCTGALLTCSDEDDTPVTEPTPKPTSKPTPSPVSTPSPTEADETIDTDGNCDTCSVTVRIDGYYTASHALYAVYPAYYQCYYALRDNVACNKYYISGWYSYGTDNYGNTFTLTCSATIYDHDQAHAYQEYVSSDEFDEAVSTAMDGYGTVDGISASDVTSVSGAAASNISVDNDNGKITISWWAILLIVAGLLVVGLGLGFVIGRCRYKNSPGFQPQATY